MCRLCNIFKKLLLSIAMLTGVNLFAQEEKLARAEQLRLTNPEQAILIMDSVIQHPQTKNDYITWTTRAYIYYEMYKKKEKLKLNSPLRDSILSSVKMSNELKPDSQMMINNNNIIKNLALGYRKIAKILLEDSVNYERSLLAFNKYLDLMTKFDPKTDRNAAEIEFNQAAGSTYSDIFNKDNKNTKAGDIAKIALLKVISMQPNNTSANLNLGLMYYNQAANLSKSLDYGADFTEIDMIQDNMIKLAKQSEQLIKNVYTVDPDNIKAIQAFYFIYRMLNDQTKFEEFKVKCKDKKINLEDETPTTKPEETKENNTQNKEK